MYKIEFKNITKKQKIALGIGIPLGIGAIYGITKLSDSFGWWANLMAKLKGKPAAPYMITPKGKVFKHSGQSYSQREGYQTGLEFSMKPSPQEHGFPTGKKFAIEVYKGAPNAQGQHSSEHLILKGTAISRAIPAKGVGNMRVLGKHPARKHPYSGYYIYLS